MAEENSAGSDLKAYAIQSKKSRQNHKRTDDKTIYAKSS